MRIKQSWAQPILHGVFLVFSMGGHATQTPPPFSRTPRHRRRRQRRSSHRRQGAPRGARPGASPGARGGRTQAARPLLPHPPRGRSGALTCALAPTSRRTKPRGRPGQGSAPRGTRTHEDYPAPGLAASPPPPRLRQRHRGPVAHAPMRCLRRLHATAPHHRFQRLRSHLPALRAVFRHGRANAGGGQRGESQVPRRPEPPVRVAG
jgi:hypothetical protein